MTKVSLIRSNQQLNILKAAEKCFVDHGIALTTMKTISEEAGIYRRTLYNYFQNKEEIAYMIHEHYIENAYSFQIDKNKNGCELLSDQFNDLVDNLDSYLPYIQFSIQFEFYFHSIEDNEKILESMINIHIVESLQEILMLGIKDGSIYLPDGDINMIGQSIIQAVVGYVKRVIYREDIFKMESGFTRKELHYFFKVLLRGLKP